jgi:molybdenum cofactor biosynthesis enzyme MoaA
MLDLGLREKLQGNFDLDRESFKEIKETNWILYNNANLNIHLTDKCNADCAFCIAHLRYLNEGLKYIKPEIKEDFVYFERLEYVLSRLKDNNVSLSITGGEPTLNRKLVNTLKILDKFNVRKRVITTNGTGLFFKTLYEKTILEHLVDYKLEYLNISRSHYNEDINSNLMTMRKDSFTNSQLKEVVEESKKSNIIVRLSCVLLSDGINSYDEINKYVDWANNLGVESIVFRQLMNFDNTKVKSGRIPNFCRDQAVYLKTIFPLLDDDKQYELFKQVLGYYYYVEIRKFKHMTVSAEIADLTKVSNQLNKYREKFNKETAFELIFHPNGNLCAGWNENDNIIL